MKDLNLRREFWEVNEEWNVAVESVMGRPADWNADYLVDAKAALQAIDKAGE